MRYRDRAICVRTTDYSETSQVVHFFTRTEGLVSLIAKGSKRKKSKSGGAIDLLSQGDLVWSGKNSEALGIVIEFTETVSRTPLRRARGPLYTALLMIELIDRFMKEGDPHPEVFDLLDKAVTRLCQPDAPAPAVLAYFQWRLLRSAGLMGDMVHCTDCDKQVLGAGVDRDRPVYFSSRLGGLLCEDCEHASMEKYPLDAETLEGMEILHTVGAGKRRPLPDPQAHAVNRLLAYHIVEQTSKPLRLEKYAIGKKGEAKKPGPPSR
ncbi:MAG: DNA repair protein RecO [Phycisphaerae bacterium]